MGPLQLTKYETKGTFLSSLVNWKRFESAALDCIKKNLQYFIFFMNWEKLRSPARATFKNPKISLWSTAEDLHSKILILNSWFNWEKLCPNLYFTIENMRDELFDILPKQRTCEMRARQVKVYVQQWLYYEQGAKFL